MRRHARGYFRMSELHEQRASAGEQQSHLPIDRPNLARPSKEAFTFLRYDCVELSWAR